jgi:hypothetical protein
MAFFKILFCFIFIEVGRSDRRQKRVKKSRGEEERRESSVEVKRVGAIFRTRQERAGTKPLSQARRAPAKT